MVAIQIEQGKTACEKQEKPTKKVFQFNKVLHSVGIAGFFYRSANTQIDWWVEMN